MSVEFKIDYVDLNQIEKQLGIAPKDVQNDENVKKLNMLTKLINKIFKNFTKVFSDKRIKNRTIKGLNKELDQVDKILKKEIKPRNLTLESAKIEKNLFQTILGRSNRIRKVLEKISDKKNKNFIKCEKKLNCFTENLRKLINNDMEFILNEEIEELSNTIYETNKNLKNHELRAKYKNNKKFMVFIKKTIKACETYEKEERETELKKRIDKWNKKHKLVFSIINDMVNMDNVKYNPLFKVNLNNANEFINDLEKLTVKHKKNFLKKANKKLLDLKQRISDNKGKISKKEK